MELIAKNIRKIRESRGWTQLQLAKIAGVSKQSVQKDEAGERSITENKIRRYAKALGVTEAIILGLDNGTVSDLEPTSHEKGPSAAFGPETVPLLGRSKLSSDKFDFTGGKIGTAPRHPNQVGAEEPVCVLMPNTTMEPRYDMGERVYINKGYAPTLGKDCAIEYKNGDGDVKRFESMADGQLVCRQFNPPKKVKIALSEIVSVHAVVGRGE